MSGRHAAQDAQVDDAQVDDAQVDEAGDGNQSADTPQESAQEPDEPEYLDRDKLDFDPDDGLYSGTAVDGTSEIPGPHEQQDDVGDSAPDAGDGDNADGTGESGQAEGIEQRS
ncbi:MAG TPA: hypothetical protein VGH01_04565 [Jatrophihabitantaceae bacterium]